MLPAELDPDQPPVFQILPHRRYDLGQVVLPRVRQAKPAWFQLRGGKSGKPFVQTDLGIRRVGQEDIRRSVRKSVLKNSQVTNEDLAVVIRLLGEGNCHVLALFFLDLVQQAVEFARAEGMSCAAQEYGDANGRWK